MLTRIAILWAIFAAVMGFAVGGSTVWSFQTPLQSQKQSYASDTAPAHSADHEPTKTLRNRLSKIWARTWDDPVAFYTFVLSIFTGLLAVVSAVQIGFLIRSDGTARRSADAATLSAKAAIAIELPIIRAGPDFFGWGQRRSGSEPAVDSFSVREVIFNNLGRTKAFPIEIQFGYFVGNKLPEIPVYNFTEAFSVDAVIESEPFHKRLGESEFDVAPGTLAGVQAGSVRLWFYCNLIYLDFMQTRREAGFCWERWQKTGASSFRTDPTPAYNRKS